VRRGERCIVRKLTGSCAAAAASPARARSRGLFLPLLFLPNESTRRPMEIPVIKAPIKSLLALISVRGRRRFDFAIIRGGPGAR